VERTSGWPRKLPELLLRLDLHAFHGTGHHWRGRTRRKPYIDPHLAGARVCRRRYLHVRLREAAQGSFRSNWRPSALPRAR
jgi:hypothetical protein